MEIECCSRSSFLFFVHRVYHRTLSIRVIIPLFGSRLAKMIRRSHVQDFNRTRIFTRESLILHIYGEPLKGTSSFRHRHSHFPDKYLYCAISSFIPVAIFLCVLCFQRRYPSLVLLNEITRILRDYRAIAIVLYDIIVFI